MVRLLAIGVLQTCGIMVRLLAIGVRMQASGAWHPVQRRDGHRKALLGESLCPMKQGRPPGQNLIGMDIYGSKPCHAVGDMYMRHRHVVHDAARARGQRAAETLSPQSYVCAAWSTPDEQPGGPPRQYVVQRTCPPSARSPCRLSADTFGLRPQCVRGVTGDTTRVFLSFPVRRYCQVDERTMMEIYFPPFRAAVEAGVLAVMCAPARACAINDRPTPVLFLAGAG